MNKKLLFLSLATAVLLAGCAKNEHGISDDVYSDVQILTSSELASDEVVAAKNSSRAAADPAREMTFYLVRADETGPGTDVYGAYGTTPISAVRAAGTGATALSFATPQYYLFSNAKTRLTGWYPEATSLAGSTVSWTIDGATDILTAPEQWGNMGVPMSNLVFNHALSQVQIHAYAPDANAQATWGTITNIELVQQINTCTYNFATNSATGAVMPKIGTTGTFAVSNIAATTIPVVLAAQVGDPVMIAPQATATVLKLEVTTSKLGKVGVLMPAGVYTQGKAYILKLKFNAFAITATASIGTWQTIDRSEQEVLPPPPPINPPASTDYVEIYGLKWAKGNLVAKNSNECKVGAPGDYGLYFQFGSLVGWTGGAGNGTGQGSPALDKAVWPTAMGTSKPSYAWQDKNVAGTSTLAHYYFNYSAAPWAIQGQDIREFAVAIDGDSGSGTLADGRYAALGVGDPCTYYLGAPWRLPTTTELASITGKTGSNSIPWTTSGVTGRWAASGDSFGGVSGPGGWFGSPLSAGSGTPSSSVNPFFPASGNRYFSNGSFINVTTYGYYWSSSVYSATHGYNLTVHESVGVVPQYNFNRSLGFPVRCVSGTYVPPPPAVGDYYYADGSYATELTAGKTATGMIYYVDPVDPQKYKVMSLEEAPTALTWSPSSYVVTAARSDADGKANSVAVRAYFEANSGVVGTNYAVAFPAFNYCYNYKGKSGSDAVGTWYLPAKSELQYLWCAYNGKAPVTWDSGASAAAPADAAKQTAWNARIKAAGIAAGITSSYLWSSTENGGNANVAWYVNFSGGSTYNYDKSSTTYVRCVRDN